MNGVKSQESNLLTYLRAYLKFTTLGTVLSQVTLCSAKKNKGKISAQSCSVGGGGTGGRETGRKGGGRCTGGGRRGGGKRDSQRGGKQEKKGKITQHCAIFHNRKIAKGREPKNTGREAGLKGAGSGRFKPPCPPPFIDYPYIFYSSSIQVGPLFVKNTENSMNSKKVVECVIIERPGGKRA